MQLAAIDMGSNSFRLEIASCSDGIYRRIDYVKETVRLGAGLDENKRLVGPAVDRGLKCLQLFRRRLADLAAHQVRAVATQTLREASNRNEFLNLASEALGQPIEVISGREEARLIYRGVARLQPSDARRLVIDIGGRSTEMILGQGQHIGAAESYGVGSVSLSQRFFAQGRFTAQAFKAARIAAAAEFEEARDVFRPSEWSEALGSSGTASAISQLLAARGLGDGAITMDGLEWCMQACQAAGTADQLALRGLKADRAPVIGGGLAILAALFDLFDLRSLEPAKGALRQGLIFDLVERLDGEDLPDHHELRDDSVEALQRRFEVDLQQATRVRRTALAIHAQLAPRADHEQLRELGWSADLHEIGMAISHHDHHRHSAYLIAHADAAGFSQSQQRRLAHLVLGQRGGLRKVHELCADPARVHQLLALRLAVLLCHPRVDPPEGLQVTLDTQPKGRALKLRWPAGWAVELPRMVYLLDKEAVCWAGLDDVEVSTGPVK